MKRNWYNANSMEEQEELGRAALIQYENMRHFESNMPLERLVEDIRASVDLSIQMTGENNE